MKKFTRTLALLLAILSVTTIFSGCGEVPGEQDYVNSDWSKKIVIDVMTFDTGEADPNS